MVHPAHIVFLLPGDEDRPACLAAACGEQVVDQARAVSVNEVLIRKKLGKRFPVMCVGCKFALIEITRRL